MHMTKARASGAVTSLIVNVDPGAAVNLHATFTPDNVHGAFIYCNGQDGRCGTHRLVSGSRELKEEEDHLATIPVNVGRLAEMDTLDPSDDGLRRRSVAPATHDHHPHHHQPQPSASTSHRRPSASSTTSSASTFASTSTSSSSHAAAATTTPATSLLRAALSLFFPAASPFYYPARAVVLFALGFLFSIIIDHLQKEHNITRYPPHHSQVFSTASWVPLCCGFSGCLVGTVYPLSDVLLLKKPQKVRREWASVIRCCGGFIGVNYAASKLPWTSSVQVSITLALLAIGLWFLFDRTWHGFVISAVVAVIGTWVVYMLVKHGAYSITKPDFYGVRSWFPCILYSSSICFGSIGRQLAVIPYHHHYSQRRSDRRKAE
ncbi:Insulin-induced protein 2 protein [Phlyctochytrium bullatum]|nr:Insulin-induced protein 2 protein [Phlyctochytrium bullatum]